ncbi:MAG: helix-turn-helix transcriptional regulator [Chloroflexota bacterium]
MRNRLEELRAQRSWTQEDLADRVDVSRQTIISLERGRYNPSITLAFRLARLFGMQIEDVFLYADEEDGRG